MADVTPAASNIPVTTPAVVAPTPVVTPPEVPAAVAAGNFDALVPILAAAVVNPWPTTSELGSKVETAIYKNIGFYDIGTQNKIVPVGKGFGSWGNLYGYTSSGYSAFEQARAQAEEAARANVPAEAQSLASRSLAAYFAAVNPSPDQTQSQKLIPYSAPSGGGENSGAAAEIAASLPAGSNISALASLAAAEGYTGGNVGGVALPTQAEIDKKLGINQPVKVATPTVQYTSPIGPTEAKPIGDTGIYAIIGTPAIEIQTPAPFKSSVTTTTPVSTLALGSNPLAKEIAPGVPTNAYMQDTESNKLISQINSQIQGIPILAQINTFGASFGKNDLGNFVGSVESIPILGNLAYGAQQSGYVIGKQEIAESNPTQQNVEAYKTAAASIISSGAAKLPSTPVDSLIQNAAPWYRENVEKPFARYIAPAAKSPITEQVLLLTQMPVYGPALKSIDTGENLNKAANAFVSSPDLILNFTTETTQGLATLAKNWPAIIPLTISGLIMQAKGAYMGITEDPVTFATQQAIFLAGGEAVGTGLHKAYELQPYRFGVEPATIIPSSGTNPPTAEYSALAITKMSGKDYQIAQISQSLAGVGGKSISPVDVILNSDILKTTTDAQFSTRMNTFATSGEAMSHFNDVALSGSKDFYHATQSGRFVEDLLSQGEITVGGANKEGALFFAQPDTILTQFAGGGKTPVALRLTDAPKITQEFLDVVGDIKSGKGVYGTDFAKTSAQLPSGFYPGLRAAAGKGYKGVGIEEEYIVSPGSKLYLKSARTMTSPSGEPWLLVDVSLNIPLLPDVKLVAAALASKATNSELFVGIPTVPKEYFDFGQKELTFAPQTPLDTAIVKSLTARTEVPNYEYGVDLPGTKLYRTIPGESEKIALGTKLHGITTSSGMKLENAATAMGEVVKAKNIPNANKVTEAIVQVEIDYGAKIYGSAVQKGAGVEKGIVTLPQAPNDIDLYIPGTPEGKPLGLSFASDVTNAINRAAGKTVAIVDESGTVTLKDGGGKLFDIHNENPPIEELLSQGSNPTKPQSLYYGIGMKPEAFLESSEGIGVMSYSEQIGRKLSGVSEFTFAPRTTASRVYEGGPEEFSVTGRIGPRFTGRVKDIPGFYAGEKGSIALMERSGNPLVRNAAGEANAMLENWLDLWGEKPAEAVRKGQPAETDINGIGQNPSMIRTTQGAVDYRIMGEHPVLNQIVPEGARLRMEPVNEYATPPTGMPSTLDIVGYNQEPTPGSIRSFAPGTKPTPEQIDYYSRLYGTEPRNIYTHPYNFENQKAIAAAKENAKVTISWEDLQRAKETNTWIELPSGQKINPFNIEDILKPEYTKNMLPNQEFAIARNPITGVVSKVYVGSPNEGAVLIPGEEVAGMDVLHTHPAEPGNMFVSDVLSPEDIAGTLWGSGDRGAWLNQNFKMGAVLHDVTTGQKIGTIENIIRAKPSSTAEARSWLQSFYQKYHGYSEGETDISMERLMTEPGYEKQVESSPGSRSTNRLFDYIKHDIGAEQFSSPEFDLTTYQENNPSYLTRVGKEYANSIREVQAKMARSEEMPFEIQRVKFIVDDKGIHIIEDKRIGALQDTIFGGTRNTVVYSDIPNLNVLDHYNSNFGKTRSFVIDLSNIKGERISNKTSGEGLVGGALYNTSLVSEPVSFISAPSDYFSQALGKYPSAGDAPVYPQSLSTPSSPASTKYPQSLNTPNYAATIYPPSFPPPNYPPNYPPWIPNYPPATPPTTEYPPGYPPSFPPPNYPPNYPPWITINPPWFPPYKPPKFPPLLPPNNPPQQHKKKRKIQSPIVFREILPIITPIEEVGGFKQGRPFFRAIGNQQILKVSPEKRDYLHYVDVDEDIQELQQKDTGNRVSNLAGMNFYRTATKQEKAKTGKPILSYIPTQQEISMAKMVGFGPAKKKSGEKKLWLF